MVPIGVVVYQGFDELDAIGLYEVAREIEHERRGRIWTRDGTAGALHLKDDSVTIDRSGRAPPR
jgi:hypothetical protein